MNNIVLRMSYWNGLDSIALLFETEFLLETYTRV